MKKSTIKRFDDRVYSDAAMLRAALSPFGILVEFSSLNELTPVFISLKLHKSKKRPIKGQMTKQQVDAFKEILALLVRKNPKTKKWEFAPTHIAIKALTQAGKTGLISVCAYLPLAIYLLTGKFAHFTRFIVNNKTLETQSRIAYNNFIAMYDHTIRLKCGPKSFTLASFNNMTRDKFPELTKFERDWTLRTSGHLKDAFRNLVEYTECKNIYLISMCDEAQARIDKNGVMHQMMRSDDQWISDKAIFLGLSATNYAFGQMCDERGYPTVKMYPGEHYTGYRWLDDEAIDMIVPAILSLQDLDELAGTNLSFKDISNLLDNNWEGYQEKQKKQYRKQWAAQLVQLARFCLFGDGVPGVAKKGKGILVRAVNHNATMTLIVDILRMLSPDIVWILYNADTKCSFEEEKTAIEQTIEYYAGPIENRTPFVMIFTGDGRMGADCPADCKYGIDFTKESEPQPLIQSIAGRITGYFKGKTCVVLSEKNARMLRRYVETGRWEKFKERTEEWKPVSPKRQHLCQAQGESSHAIAADELPPKTAKLFQKMIDECAKIIKNNHPKAKRKKRVYRLPAPVGVSRRNWRKKNWDLFEPVANLIEQRHTCSVRRPEELGELPGETSVNIRLENTVVSNNQDSQGGDRLMPVVYVNAARQLVSVKLSVLSQTPELEPTGRALWSEY